MHCDRKERSYVDYQNLVVTGTGRSGTRYASELFTSLGLPTSHQQTFDHKCKGAWKWAPVSGDASGFAAPWVTLVPENVLVIHQVRHPADTIRSLLANWHVPGCRGPGTRSTNPGVDYYAKHVPEIFEVKDMVERTCLLWCRWNQLVERISDQPNYIFHRLEDYNAEFLVKVLGFFDMEWTPERARRFHAQSKKTGANPSATGFSKQRPSLAHITGPVGYELRETAARYGYEV